MRNLKRVFSLALALVMVLGMMVIGTSAATFTDAEEITYTEAVEVMSAIGVINGMGDGTFAPKGTLTRAQAAKILAFVTMGAAADEYLTGSAAAFTDIEGHWAANYITYCANLGIINGLGDGTFNPEGTLKVVEFAKMLLVAAGIDGEYTGANWANNVKTAAGKTEMKNTGIKITNAEISREEACALALAAMKSGGTTTRYYDVVVGGEVVDSFTDIVDAYVMKDVVSGTVEYRDVTSGALLDEVHGVNYIADDADAFKNPGVGYEKTVQGKKVIDLFYGEEAALTFDESINTVAGKKALVKALEAEGVELTELGTDTGNYRYATGLKAIVDGAEAGFCGSTDNLAALTADNAVVKVYINNKAVTKITKVVTHTDKVLSVTPADEENEVPAYVTLTDTNTFDTEAFAKDDIVLYTIANGEVQTMVKAASVTGTLTGYNSDNVYTIGGETYKVGAGADTNDAAVKAEINKTKVWHLGVDGGIVAVTNVPGDAPVAPSTTYAYITDAVAVADDVTDNWGNTTTKGYEVQVKAVLSDGTSGVYDLAAYKNNSQAWVVKVGQAEVAVGDVDTTLVGNIYPYTLADGVLTLNTKLAIFSGAETADAVVIRDNSVAVNKTSTTITVSGGHTVIANNETVFILAKDTSDPSKGLVVKTGLAALEGTTIPAWTKVVISVDYNEKTQTATNVAKVVFAQGTEFAATGAVDTTDYVYFDGKYSYAKAEDGTETYTGTAVKVDGTTVTVTGTAVASGVPGIYVLKSDNTLNTTAVTTTKVTVGTIAGSTYDIGGYVTVNDATKVISVAEGAALATGAEAYAVTANGVANVVFVVKAAPAN